MRCKTGWPSLYGNFLWIYAAEYIELPSDTLSFFQLTLLKRWGKAAGIFVMRRSHQRGVQISNPPTQFTTAVTTQWSKRCMLRLLAKDGCRISYTSVDSEVNSFYSHVSGFCAFFFIPITPVHNQPSSPKVRKWFIFWFNSSDPGPNTQKEPREIINPVAANHESGNVQDAPSWCAPGPSHCPSQVIHNHSFLLPPLWSGGRGRMKRSTSNSRKGKLHGMGY